jgi:hypothetical protein
MAFLSDLVARMMLSLLSSILSFVVVDHQKEKKKAHTSTATLQVEDVTFWRMVRALLVGWFVFRIVAYQCSLA